MTIFMLFNFVFHHFIDWTTPKSTNCKKPHFFENCGFLQFVNYGVVPVNKESLENGVADVHLNVPWAHQAEKKSLYPGCQKKQFN